MCPTCDHTMHSLADNIWWCPRCGTIKTQHEPCIYEPWLVERAVQYLVSLDPVKKSALQECCKKPDRVVRKMLLVRPLPEPSGKSYIASGDALCLECGHEIRLHPMDPDELSYHDQPFLHVLCNGDRVKT